MAGRIGMRHALIGRHALNHIHGGGINAVLDAMAAIGARHIDDTLLQRLHRFAK